MTATRLPVSESLTSPLVLKFGGELLEDRDRVSGVVAGVAAIVAARRPASLVIVHGGGKEIDRALSAAGIEKRQVEGLRVTDDATLEIVVSVLGGGINTRLVASLSASGVPAVGVTGADGSCALADVAPPHETVDGRFVDLGRVGLPSADSDPRLLESLLASGFVPVVACIGLARDGRLLNVNADTLAGFLAGRLRAARLVIAGATPGVLDETGNTIARLDTRGIQRVIAGGTATAGMVAKLRACDDALRAGVRDVVIVDGRDRRALEEAAGPDPGRAATVLVGSSPESNGVGASGGRDADHSR